MPKVSIVRLVTTDNAMISILRFLFLITCIAPLESKIWASESGDGDVRVRYEILRQLATSGDAVYQYGLFAFVDDHKSEIPDRYDEAFQFLVKSAKEGYVESEYLLGYMTLTGEADELSVEEGLDLLRSASQKGHGRSRYWLAEYYMSLWFGREFSAATEAPDGPKYADKHFNSAKSLYESLIQEETDEPDLVRSAQLRLSTLLLANSIDDETGWKLLFDLADSGYSPARERLERLRAMLVKGVNEGFGEASELLSRIDEYLEKTNP